MDAQHEAAAAPPAPGDVQQTMALVGALKRRSQAGAKVVPLDALAASPDVEAGTATALTDAKVCVAVCCHACVTASAAWSTGACVGWGAVRRTHLFTSSQRHTTQLTVDSLPSCPPLSPCLLQTTDLAPSSPVGLSPASTKAFGESSLHRLPKTFSPPPPSDGATPPVLRFSRL
jgi:hypothetical protein